MYMPAAHFLIPLGGHFLRFHAFCSFYKARPCADILPFSFPRVVLSVQVWVLSPNPAEPGWLLCMLISYLQRLALITVGECAGSQPWSGGYVREVSEHWGYLWASWGDLQAKHPQAAHAGFLMESVKSSVGSISLWYVWALVVTFSAPPHPSVIQLTLVFWVAQERSGSPWQHPAQLGKQGTHSHTLLFPHGRNHRPRGSLGTKFCHLGEGWCQYSELFSYPLQWI